MRVTRSYSAPAGQRQGLEQKAPARYDRHWLHEQILKGNASELSSALQQWKWESIPFLAQCAALKSVACGPDDRCFLTVLRRCLPASSYQIEIYRVMQYLIQENRYQRFKEVLPYCERLTADKIQQLYVDVLTSKSCQNIDFFETLCQRFPMGIKQIRPMEYHHKQNPWRWQQKVAYVCAEYQQDRRLEKGIVVCGIIMAALTFYIGHLVWNLRSDTPSRVLGSCSLFQALK